MTRILLFSSLERHELSTLFFDRVFGTTGTVRVDEGTAVGYLVVLDSHEATTVIRRDNQIQFVPPSAC